MQPPACGWVGGGWIEGFGRGGEPSCHTKDRHLGNGYIANFDHTQLERSGGQLVTTRLHGDHYDVIERFSDGVLHHRIYRP